MASAEAKVVILGAQGVGKTSFINRYVGQIFMEHPSPTIGASLFSCTVNIDEHSLKFLIWDTAGQERFRAMTPMYYRNANAAVLMFDISSRSSYDDMMTWITELKDNIDDPIVVCLVGNKSDKRNQRQVETKEAAKFASSIGALYHETSALSSEGIADVFIDIGQELIRRRSNPKQTKSENVRSTTFSKGKVINLSPRETSVAEKSLLCC